jgi:hypothetical protein
MVVGLLRVRKSRCRLAPACRGADAQVALMYLRYAVLDARAACAKPAEIEITLAGKHAVLEDALGTLKAYVLQQFMCSTYPLVLASVVVHKVATYVDPNPVIRLLQRIDVWLDNELSRCMRAASNLSTKGQKTGIIRTMQW